MEHKSTKSTNEERRAEDTEDDAPRPLMMLIPDPLDEIIKRRLELGWWQLVIGSKKHRKNLKTFPKTCGHMCIKIDNLNWLSV